MADFGDIGLGLIGGLQKGIGSYYEQKALNDRLNAEMASKGLLYDKDSGSWGADPAFTAKERKKRLQESMLNLLDKGYKVDQSSFDEEGYLKGVPEINQDFFKARADANPLTALSAQLKLKELNQPVLTPGQKALDEAQAKNYAEYTRGGAAGAAKNIANVENAVGLLKSKEVETGGLRGYVPKIARDAFMPKLSQAQDSLEQAVQGTMRDTLGAQFTATEGEGIMKRTFNAGLPKEENIRRATLLLNELKAAAEAKDAMNKYFEQRGTMQGYTGPKTIDLERRIRGFSPDSQPSQSQGLLKSSGKDSFPMTIMKDGHTATVSNKKELEEAMAEGWK